MMFIQRRLGSYKPFVVVVCILVVLLVLAKHIRFLPKDWVEERVADDSYYVPVRKPVTGPTKILPTFQDIQLISKQKPSILELAEAEMVFLRIHALTQWTDTDVLKVWSQKQLLFSYHSYLDNIQVPCDRVMKMGDVHIWGNHICDDDAYRPRKPCLGYSVAANSSDINLFWKDVTQLYGCQVQFQPSSSNSEVDVVRMNLNGGEWEALAKMAAAGQLGRVRQLLVTLTTSEGDSKNADTISQRLQVLKTLHDAGFRIFRTTLRESAPRINGVYLVIRTASYEVGFVNTKPLTNWASQAVQESPLSSVSSVSSDEQNMDFLRQLQLPQGRLPTKTEIASMPDKQVQYTYHRFLDNPSIQCNLIVKLGNLEDGGYRVCDDERFRPSKPCLVYSFGIRGDFSFDDDAAKFYGCEVFSFDPSTGESHRRSDKVTYYKLGIGGSQGVVNDSSEWQLEGARSPKDFHLESFTDIKFLLGHQGKAMDILKIDVEGAEWSALVDMAKSGELSTIRQLAIEFHLWEGQNAKTTRRELAIVGLLAEAGFRLFYSHMYWWWRSHTFSIPKLANVYPVVRTICYEISFVNTRFEMK